MHRYLCSYLYTQKVRFDNTYKLKNAFFSFAKVLLHESVWNTFEKISYNSPVEWVNQLIHKILVTKYLSNIGFDIEPRDDILISI